MSKTVFINNKIVEDCKQNNAKAQMQLYEMYCQAMFIIAQRYMKDGLVGEGLIRVNLH